MFNISCDLYINNSNLNVGFAKIQFLFLLKFAAMNELAGKLYQILCKFDIMYSYIQIYKVSQIAHKKEKRYR